jgi:hypothetical protein
MLAALCNAMGTASAQQPNYLADPPVFVSDDGVFDVTMVTPQQILIITYAPPAIAGFTWRHSYAHRSVTG